MLTSYANLCQQSTRQQLSEKKNLSREGSSCYRAGNCVGKELPGVVEGGDVGKSRSDTENTHKGQSQSNTED
jgi:hypothetical protein